jgi:hypothetical protein
MNAAGCLLMTATPIAASNDATASREWRILAHNHGAWAMCRWSGQDIAALTLARDLRILRLAQRSAACSPRLPGVAAETSRCAFMAPLGGVERPRRVVRFARLMHRRVRALSVWGPQVNCR